MLTGKRPNAITHFTDTTISHLTKRLQTHDYPMLVKRLHELSVIANFRNNSKEFHELMKVLDEIENRLLHFEREPYERREDFEVETINVESARVFRQYGGIEIVKRILLVSLLVADRDERSGSCVLRRKGKCAVDGPGGERVAPVNMVVENFSILKIKCKCIHILNRIVCLVSGISLWAAT